MEKETRLTRAAMCDSPVEITGNGILQKRSALLSLKVEDQADPSKMPL